MPKNEKVMVTGNEQKNMENAIDEFQAATQKFEDVFERQKTYCMASDSRLTEMRNEIERLASEIEAMKTKRKAFEIEIPKLEEAIGSRKRELKELLNT